MDSARRPRWQVWIDRGGTFTDCIGRDPGTGALRVVKVLSSDRAPIDGLRRLLELPDDAPIPPCDIRMGTTVATNALLTRGGAPTGLAITRGFGDLLEIGDQTRPDLFALAIEKPAPLPCAVVELDARAGPGGEALARPDPIALREQLGALRSAGAVSLAVVVLHAYTDEGARLEREVGAVARSLGFVHVALSHEVTGEQGIVGRGDTTVLDAYVTPPLGAHVNALLDAAVGSHLRLMQSSGDLIEASRFRGRDAILSGPAAGVVAVAELARRLGLPQVIGLDMGGTSTDVSRVAGELPRIYESQVAGVRVRAPMIAIHTVAAGGGSICSYDGRRFQVGPESAGAEPGPLCYGDPSARELTLTDVSLALGRVVDSRFPFPLARAPVMAALEVVAAATGRTREEVAWGFYEVAVANTAAAIRAISVGRGHDVRAHAMIVFGGAGGQYACAVARLLGIRELVFPPLAGVLSALGMGLAQIGWLGEADAGRRPLSAASLGALEPVFAELEARGRAALAEETEGEVAVEARRRLDLRYRGTQTALTIPLTGDVDDLRSAFAAVHEREFGYRRPGHVVEIAVARAELRVMTPPPATEWAAPTSDALPAAPSTTTLWADGRAHADAPVYWRETLTLGQVVTGPALVLAATGTIVLDPGFRAEVDAHGCLVARDVGGAAASVAGLGRATDEPATALDPVLLEIMGNRIMAIAEQMGVVLQRTALSTNIRERLDFSCAVFDRHGGLVANAPHIPVHLGAMSESIRGVLRAHPNPRPGEVFATNDPAEGGSHLPDITVIAPWHDRAGRLRFFTASRGHHADVGGITPGSMPPFSRSLADEGAVLRSLRIVDGGVLDRAAIERALTSGPHPARDPAQNLADLEAQIAATRTGARLLDELVADYGVDGVAAYMGHVQDHGAACVAEAIAGLPSGTHRFVDAMDDGTAVAVAITITGARMHVDFTGTGAEQRDGNLNAPRAVTIAALLYVLRLLAGRPIPLNGGCMRPVTVFIPPGSLLSPGPDRAVAAGNVETAQRVVDVLLGALGLAAASQGTMNNLTFGDDHFGYYETLGGGAGASAGSPGAAGVHTHMTNTRITDPEVLEARFPVRVRCFGLRRGSGGAGRFPGGAGLVRELEFLRPVRVSLLGDRRERAPFGLRGGGPGAPGRDSHNGARIPGRHAFAAAPGDVIRIETPGGGGFGDPEG